MKIGIALCTYNGERYLHAQLDSIAGQTRPPDVVVVSDDASRDGTLAILESWTSRVPFDVRILRNSRTVGYLRNFEQAIASCDTDLIALSDQDDRWHADKIARLEAAFLCDAQAGAVFSDADIVDEALVPLGCGLLDVLRVGADEREAALAGRLLPVLLRRNIVAGATLAIRASWRQRVLPMPDSVVHDEWIALLAAAEDALRFVPERLILYRQHGGNQIGARRWSLSEHLRVPQPRRRDVNRRLLALMKGLRERLGHSEFSIDAKIAHLERRVALPELRLLRLPAVAVELARGRYARYSSGWRTAVRDLVSP